MLRSSAFVMIREGEYMSTAFDDYLKAAGIHRQHTVRNEPHQNGVAECANRTIGEGVTAILKESRLPPSFWGYALNAFVYVHVRSPYRGHIDKADSFGALA